MTPTKTTHPEPRVVSGYLATRRTSGDPPPTPEQIREQLGWKLIPHNDDR